MYALLLSPSPSCRKAGCERIEGDYSIAVCMGYGRIPPRTLKWDRLLRSQTRDEWNYAMMPRYSKLNSGLATFSHNFPTGTNNISEGIMYQSEEGLASPRNRKIEWLWHVCSHCRDGCTTMMSSWLFVNSWEGSGGIAIIIATITTSLYCVLHVSATVLTAFYALGHWVLQLCEEESLLPSFHCWGNWGSEKLSVSEAT